METAFPNWMATDSLCRRNVVDLGSPDWRVILFPRSLMKDIVFGPKTPDDSMAIGVKKWEEVKLEYFSSFSASALVATSPADWADKPRYEQAKIITNNKSKL